MQRLSLHEAAFAPWTILSYNWPVVLDSAMPTSPPLRRGRIALFGSGETGRHGRRVHELLLAQYQRPVPVTVLETPAGFQPNSGLLAEKVKQFFEHNLQNFRPDVTIIPARRRGDEPEGTDYADYARAVTDSSYVFAGAGSPTYAVQHLRDSHLWAATVDRLNDGGTLALASAMALAVSQYTLPVYEIFKVGQDLHWLDGLNLFRHIELNLTIVPHWNNNEGGTELDTSHCYMGEERFTRLVMQLPPNSPMLAIDEHTACVIDIEQWSAEVHGAGAATIIRGERRSTYPAHERFSLNELS